MGAWGYYDTASLEFTPLACHIANAALGDGPEAPPGAWVDADAPEVSLVDGKYWVFGYERAGPLLGSASWADLADVAVV